MKRIIALLLVFGPAGTSFCQDNTTAGLDSLLAAYHQRDKFNGSVLVAQKGKLILEKGYGFKDAGKNQYNDRNTIFRTYSITKIFTSTLVLKLAEEKKLSLTDPLSKYYSGFGAGDSITIAQLLSHTSGIYDYTRGNDMPDQSEKSMIDFLRSKKLDFLPGTDMNYSNSGYWLLGFIIEKVSGLSYGEALQKYIFRVAGMKNSGLDFKFLQSSDRATGYSSLNSAKQVASEIYDPPGPYAAGAIHSTVGDLYKFAVAVSSGKIISKKMLELAQTAVKRNYGLGWIIGKYENKKMVSHSGGAAGFRTNFIMIPEDSTVIVVLSNSEQVNTDFISSRILDRLHHKLIMLPAEIPLTDSVLEKYTGTFFTAQRPLIFYISRGDGRLKVQVSRNPETIVYAETKTRFFAEEAEATIEFFTDSSGFYNRVEVVQRGEKIAGKRIYPSWGILGDAAGISWDGNEDLKLTEDSTQPGLWFIRQVKLNKGEFKFRFNNDWTINYGAGSMESILESYGKNIAVEAGTYDIFLDLNQMKYMIKRVK